MHAHGRVLGNAHKFDIITLAQESTVLNKGKQTVTTPFSDSINKLLILCMVTVDHSNDMTRITWR